eukprot:scaffold31004_cov51-Phaeocystis_antarctica.AAC.2
MHAHVKTRTGTGMGAGAGAGSGTGTHLLFVAPPSFLPRHACVCWQWQAWPDAQWQAWPDAPSSYCSPPLAAAARWHSPPLSQWPHRTPQIACASPLQRRRGLLASNRTRKVARLGPRPGAQDESVLRRPRPRARQAHTKIGCSTLGAS